MEKIRIGDLVSLKNHPYEIGTLGVKISALASMTPPILVVSEMMNTGKEYDSEAGQQRLKQVRCFFYSHKSHKFESYWFNMNQIKPIIKFSTDGDGISDNVKEINTSETDNLKNVGIKYPKSINSLESLKSIFLNKQVILKSCDYELGKIKTTFIKTNNKSSDKVNSHLDFLPPVMTVTDVKLNEEKVNYNPKSGNQKKIFSYFLLKCKWYNPLSGSFSEDFIPIEIVQLVPEIISLDLISELITSNKLIFHKLKEPLKLDCGLELNYTLIQPLELVFNHYKYEVKYSNFFETKYSKCDLFEIEISSNIIEFEDIVIDKIPQYNSKKREFSYLKGYVFEEKQFYRITYKDLMDKITNRVIFVNEVVDKKLVIADCLLRKGVQRHFRIEGILKIEELDLSYFNL